MTEGFSYAEAIKNLREKIALPELDIRESHIRKAANGGVIIEIPGADRVNKAEKLKAKVAEVLGASAKVSRPSVKGELRIIGFDDSVVVDEIADVVAMAGKCRVDEVKVGTIRAMTNGLYSAWVQCPLSAAITASQPGKIHIGWTVARVELLKARPTLCYRCWGKGHVQAQCRSKTDRSCACYRCGEEGPPGNWMSKPCGVCTL